MAIYDFFPVDGGRSGSFNDQWAREYSRSFVARSNSAFDQETEIWSHPLCPVPGQSPEWDRLSQCVSVDAKLRKGSRWTWDVIAKYSSVQVTPTKSENPLDEPPDVEVDTELVVEDRYVDRNGRPTCNTAGDLILVKVDVPRTTIVVERNVALKNAWITKIAGITNSQAFRINGEMYDAETLKVTKARIGKVQYRNGTGFYRARIEIRQKEEGWATVSLNQGYYELRPDPTGKIKDESGKPALVRWRCLTGGIDGEPEMSPVFLNEDGKRPTEVVIENNIKKVRPKMILDPEDIVLLKFDMLKLFDFNQLTPLK